MNKFFKFLLAFSLLPLTAFSQTLSVTPGSFELTFQSITTPRDPKKYNEVLMGESNIGNIKWANIGCTITQTAQVTGTLVPGYTDVFKTNISGVGVKYSITRGYLGGYAAAPFSFEINREEATGGRDYRKAELIVVGPVSSGTLTEAPSMTVTYSGTCFETVSYNVNINLNTTNFKVNSCSVETNQVNVELPDARASDFKTVNSTTGSANFSIGLKCPEGVKVYITLTDKNNAANESGVLSLAANSTASGVGVQILREGNVVNFGPDSSEKGAKNQMLVGDSAGLSSIPFTARYINTGGTIVGGSVNAAATFTMSYQ